MDALRQSRLIHQARLKIPVDVYMLAEALGITVKEAFLSDEISGMLEKTGDAFKITLNASHGPFRKRFTTAHEIGHFVLHRSLIGDGLDDNLAFRSTDAGKYHNTNIGPKEEAQANGFAANLLIPEDIYKQEIKKNPNLSNLELARLFEVSQQTMIIFRNSLKYW